MQTYRLYCFDGSGKITGAEWLQAANDEEAIEAAKGQENCIHLEVWGGDRLIAKVQARSAG
jgi:hypothetical protein